MPPTGFTPSLLKQYMCQRTTLTLLGKKSRKSFDTKQQGQ